VTLSSIRGCRRFPRAGVDAAGKIFRYNPGMRIRIRILAALILAVSLISAIDAAAQARDIAPLRRRIEQALTPARGEVGVAIKHLESGAEILINADKKYPMASTYKLPILVELFYQQAEGKLSLTADRVEFQPSDIHIGSGTLVTWAEPPAISIFNFHALIQMAMRLSDNSASDILLNRVGAGNVTQRMKTLGLDSIRVDRSTLEMILDQSGLDYSKYGALPAREVRKMLDAIDGATAARADEDFNKTDKDTAKPSDMNRLLEMIHRGEIVDRAASDEIIKILKECLTGAARIRGMLPPETDVAHKSGTISGSVNDTGIVFLPSGAGHLAVTVFMRSTRANTAARERVIAQVTRYAYDYFVMQYGKP
jgi:beta-lactamase class A